MKVIVRRTIYTSPLSRALETVRTIASPWDLAAEEWEELTEINVGVVAGLTQAEVEEQFPGVAKRLAATRDFGLIEGAEAYNETTVRAQCVVTKIIREHDNTDRVMLVTHGSMLVHIVERLLGTDRLWGIGIRNTAIFEFSIDVGSWHLEDQSRINQSLWRIVRFNDASHLD